MFECGGCLVGSLLVPPPARGCARYVSSKPPSDRKARASGQTRSRGGLPLLGTGSASTSVRRRCRARPRSSRNPGSSGVERGGRGRAPLSGPGLENASCREVCPEPLGVVVGELAVALACALLDLQVERQLVGVAHDLGHALLPVRNGVRSASRPVGLRVVDSVGAAQLLPTNSASPVAAGSGGGGSVRVGHSATVSRQGPRQTSRGYGRHLALAGPKEGRERVHRGPALPISTS